MTEAFLSPVWQKPALSIALNPSHAQKCTGVVCTNQRSASLCGTEDSRYACELTTFFIGLFTACGS